MAEYVTTNQAAALLDISAGRVCKLIRAGRLLAMRRRAPGRPWAIPVDALEWVRERPPGFPKDRPHRKKGDPRPGP